MWTLSSKTVWINNTISDYHSDLFCHTETDYVSLSESPPPPHTPPSHINAHIPRDTWWGGGVAAIFNPNLIINPRNKLHYKSFQSLALSLSRPTWKILQPVVLVVVHYIVLLARTFIWHLRACVCVIFFNQIIKYPSFLKNFKDCLFNCCR